MSILTGLDPKLVRAVHIINQLGTPSLATALRVPATECIIGEKEDFIQFLDPTQNKTLRVKVNRIALIEVEGDIQGDNGVDHEDIYEFG